MVNGSSQGEEEEVEQPENTSFEVVDDVVVMEEGDAMNGRSDWSCLSISPMLADALIPPLLLLGFNAFVAV